jgi:3-hydroxyacyl-CoA dehydrogenase
MSGTRKTIRKAAILGSGVMGMAIASHLAGCGVECLVLDIVPFDNMLSEKERALRDSGDKSIRNKMAIDSLQKALKLKPPAPAFFSPSDQKLIKLGNFDDDFEKISACDWFIEVVVERMDIKKQVLAKVDKYRAPHSIISTNTSGLSVVGMVEDCSPEMRSHFMGTHFFNPVRFMKLLEIIPHPETKPELIEFISDFCNEKLGKGVVMAKDTPNFIANRIGVHSMFLTLQKMQELDYTISEIDEICGKPVGNASSAVFKTADLVGLDTLAHVAKTVYDHCAHDEVRDAFTVPEFLSKMIEKKWLGRKADSGFYKMGKDKKRFVLDWKTLEYVPLDKPSFASLGKVKDIKDPGKRLKALVEADDRAAQLAWAVTSNALVYAANRVPEIADRIHDVDQAMCWGFNREIGPFASWDAIGLRSSVERMKKDGLAIPANIEAMLAKGNETFYKEEGGVRYQYDLVNHTYLPIEEDAKVIVLKKLPKEKKVASNDGASLWDIGDGVLLFEMHTKMNAVDNETLAMQNQAMDLLDAGKFDALVLANNAKNFSVGANLMLVFMAAQNGQLDEVEKMAKAFQDVNMRMKYSRAPVVAAPIGYTFGGGLELCLHSHAVVGAAETYCGLVEVGVGLIPAAGGTKEFILRFVEGVDMRNNPSLLPFLRNAFESIATAKVATSFKEAVDFGFFRRTDIMVANPDYRIARAKEVALGLKAVGFDPGFPREDIPVIGESGTAAFMIAVDGMKDAGWASEHDQKIANKLAYIIGGGQRAEGQTISEQELLDLEREAFMSLLTEEKTIERISHMLMNNKPLRN